MAAAGDLTTLAKVKQQLGIDKGDLSSDEILAELITTASARFLALIDRPLALATYSETWNGNGSEVWMLKQYPVVSVSLVQVDLVTIPVQPAPWQAGYVLARDPDRICLVGYGFTKGVANVTLQYQAGYATTPTDVQRAVTEMVEWRFKVRDRVGVTQKSHNGETTSYDGAPIPAMAQVAVDCYRREDI